MIRMAGLALAAASALALGACESGPTPYQVGDTSQGGYSDTRIEDNRFRITFKGNSLTDRDTVENYMLYRAAELTLQNGYDNFTIVNRDTDKDSQLREYGGGMGSRLTYLYYGPRYGWVPAVEYYREPSRYSQVTRYEASAEIFLGRGAKSSDPNAFDAAQVSKNLAGAINRPPQ